MNQSEIRVLHLATGAVGGAGLAARRLNAGLVSIGVNSKFYSPPRKGYVKFENENEFHRGFVGLLKSALSTRVQSRLHSITFFSLFSVNILSLRGIRKLADNRDTVLHFHNWFNLVSQKQIIRLANAGYKVVLTMHDERFFTGGCHYSLECEGFLTDCRSCPRISKQLHRIPKRNLRIARSLLINNNENIRFIAPSKWIAGEALRSHLLRDSSIHFIPNSLGPARHPISIPDIRARRSPLNLNIGIASMDENSHVKGGDVLASVVKFLASRESGIRFKFLNQIEDEKDFDSGFWSQIDYLLLLSRADNSPNVIHESKVRGIPVIAPNVGGMPELLTSPPDSLIADGEDVLSIAALLEKLSTNFVDTILTTSNDNFLGYIEGTLQQHADLYRNLFA
jgi:glycosyltransferase involved in cell wall biosynthesis